MLFEIPNGNILSKTLEEALVFNKNYVLGYAIVNKSV
jgi:hypothetical protein